MTRHKRMAQPQAFFMPDGDGGQRFALFHPAQGATCHGRVLYLHPFAEELNTTRRVVAQQARALAQAGYAVLQIDLLGCGDSSGAFADATWPAWQADAQRALTWLNDNATGPLWLWGLRAGALLAAHVASHLSTHPPASAVAQPGDTATPHEPRNLLLWQPVLSGQHTLQQFLRLQAAAHWLGAGGAQGLSPSQALAQGQAVDVAGYTISPALAQGMGHARLQPPPSARPGRLIWLEVASLGASNPGPAADNALAAWRQAGWQVHAQTVAGPAFWHTVGTDDAPALLQATLGALALPGAPPTTEAPAHAH